MHSLYLEAPLTFQIRKMLTSYVLLVHAVPAPDRRSAVQDGAAIDDQAAFCSAGAGISPSCIIIPKVSKAPQ